MVTGSKSQERDLNGFHSPFRHLCLWIAFVPVMCLAGISYGTEKTDDRYGGTVVIGNCSKPGIINPILTTGTISIGLLDLVFNKLVKINQEWEIEPDLVESWEVSPDGLIWTFHLRENVRFHDGTECTAEDVKFIYDMIMAPEVGSKLLSRLPPIEQLEVLDRYTVKVVLKEPYAPFLYFMRHSIAPKHLLENVDLQKTEFNRCPVGTGPFRLSEWTADDRITFVANEEYFDGRPYLDKVVVATYPDRPTLWAQMMKERVDVVPQLLVEDVSIVEADPAFEVLVYNLQDPLFADVRIRQAISYALNREDLIKIALLDYGKACAGPFYPNSWASNPGIEPYRYVPAKAAQLLAEVGWEDTDGDGFLERGGQEFKFVLLVPEGDPIRERAAKAMRLQLEEIGLKMEVDLRDLSAMLEEYLPDRTFQAALSTFTYGIDPDVASRVWHSGKIGRYNYSSYQNREVDQLFHLGRRTLDRGKRQKIYHRIHELIVQDCPAAFLLTEYAFAAIAARIEGAENISTMGILLSIKDWYVPRDESKH